MWPDGTPVADDDTFELAVCNYRANMNLLTPGTVFAEGEALPELVGTDLRSDIGNIRELLGDYIGNVCNGSVEATCDDSWQLVGYDWEPRLHERAVELVRTGAITLIDGDGGGKLCTKVVTTADLS